MGKKKKKGYSKVIVSSAPPRRYEEVGKMLIVEYNTQNLPRDFEEPIDKLRKKAYKKGYKRLVSFGTTGYSKVGNYCTVATVWGMPVTGTVSSSSSTWG